MKKKKLWTLGVMLILVLSTILAACGGSDSKDTGSKDTSSGGDSTSSNEPKTLVYGRGGDSTALDPATVTEGESFKVTVNIYETLINFGEKDVTLHPGLAKSWESSEDGLTYTMQLEEGVKFHDGTDFNAEAVVKNFERWKAGGADKFPYYASQFTVNEKPVIESITADGDYKVIFKLAQPQAPFLKNLAMSPFAIASPTAFEKNDEALKDNPVGTGPFKFVEWKRNDSITIEKNPDYRIADLPKLDKVIFRSIPDNSARFNALTNAEVDVVDGLSPSDKASIESNANLQLIERPSMNVGYLGLTVTRPPFDNVKVRQAVNHAIDKQALVDAFYEGLGETAKNPMPSIIAGYNDEVEGYDYDPEKAKALLAEAGYDGKEIELWAMPVPRPYMPDGQKIAEAIQKNLADVGMKSKIVTFEWATYLEKAENGEADAFLLGWTGDNGDADNFLYTLLDGDNIHSNNYTFYDNKEVHELFVAAQTEMDEGKRNDLYKQAQVIISKDAPWVPLAHSTPILSANTKVTNYVAHPTGSDRLDTVDVK
ncbi:peptide ABC transporter substrate-binding protein [Lysinibacillus sphaericus]|uniref:ABC transporter substrate-binding protein n=1 Tax=Lysinibacillus sphaericus TaxID=1421 RepID=UPI0018CCB7EC|nr:ABC transporter substrate-binding protein [Lysinibacillus sphaericus]MBG9454263.1 peptide ABC transporter substrate-binding protein [Lysinibacillus sphaericus]MBG9477140.1 peptide ABC transporter substrate-binding protein [Lysinibacillus sphaericus]MBG9593759.1 peptide ABC transporter substrate-binding protein [Lysinibacillus sphaericus]